MMLMGYPKFSGYRLNFSSICSGIGSKKDVLETCILKLIRTPAEGCAAV
jgi:hypothetical protein